VRPGLEAAMSVEQAGVFLVRIWFEGGSPDTGYRASVTDLKGKGKRYFSSPEELAGYLLPVVTGEQVGCGEEPE
jgi:hypothetical protein